MHEEIAPLMTCNAVIELVEHFVILQIVALMDCTIFTCGFLLYGKLIVEKKIEQERM